MMWVKLPSGVNMTQTERHFAAAQRRAEGDIARVRAYMHPCVGVECGVQHHVLPLLVLTCGHGHVMQAEAHVDAQLQREEQAECRRWLARGAGGGKGSPLSKSERSPPHLCAPPASWNSPAAARMGYFVPKLFCTVMPPILRKLRLPSHPPASVAHNLCCRRAGVR